MPAVLHHPFRLCVGPLVHLHAAKAHNFCSAISLCVSAGTSTCNPTVPFDDTRTQVCIFLGNPLSRSIRLSSLFLSFFGAFAPLSHLHILPVQSRPSVAFPPSKLSHALRDAETSTLQSTEDITMSCHSKDPNNVTYGVGKK